MQRSVERQGKLWRLPGGLRARSGLPTGGLCLSAHAPLGLWRHLPKSPDRLPELRRLWCSLPRGTALLRRRLRTADDPAELWGLRDSVSHRAGVLQRCLHESRVQPALRRVQQRLCRRIRLLQRGGVHTTEHHAELRHVRQPMSPRPGVLQRELHDARHEPALCRLRQCLPGGVLLLQRSLHTTRDERQLRRLRQHLPDGVGVLWRCVHAAQHERQLWGLRQRVSWRQSLLQRRLQLPHRSDNVQLLHRPVLSQRVRLLPDGLLPHRLGLLWLDLLSAGIQVLRQLLLSAELFHLLSG
jgi:hypothetical protein